MTETTEGVVLQPHGLHSPEYTAEVAEAFGEAVRVLNYASSGEYRDVAIPYPNVIYGLLGCLVNGTGGLPQLFRHLGDQLEALRDADRLEVRDGVYRGQPAEAVAAVRAWLEEAGTAATKLHVALQRAQSATTWMGMPSHLFDEDDDE